MARRGETLWFNAARVGAATLRWCLPKHCAACACTAQRGAPSGVCSAVVGTWADGSMAGALPTTTRYRRLRTRSSFSRAYRHFVSNAPLFATVQPAVPLYTSCRHISDIARAANNPLSAFLVLYATFCIYLSNSGAVGGSALLAAPLSMQPPRGRAYCSAFPTTPYLRYGFLFAFLPTMRDATGFRVGHLLCLSSCLGWMNGAAVLVLAIRTAGFVSTACHTLLGAVYSTSSQVCSPATNMLGRTLMAAF